MGIFVIDKDDVVECTSKAVEYEIDIEDFLEKHIEVLDPGTLVIGRQVPTSGRNAIDIMGIDREGNAVIIELKRGKSPRNVVSQALEYAVWAANTGYDDLNDIAKKRLDESTNLRSLFQSKFKSEPEPWNANQTIYIVAERISKRTKDVANYLNERGVGNPSRQILGVDIRCVEINFYEGVGKEIVSVNFVVGDQPAPIEDAAKKAAPVWDDVLSNADKGTRSAVSNFITAAKTKLKPHASPQGRYYYMRVPERDKKNLFGVVVCQKKSAYVSFIADPDTFQYNNHPEIRSVSGWFFRKKTERRINLTKSNSDLILQCLEHSRGVTLEL